MTRPRVLHRLAVLVLGLCACSALPEIAADVCGNRVIERGEDCDGFARDGLACRPAGGVGQCRMDCSAALDGTPSVCPDGFGCDPDAVCRKATGEFAALPERIIGSAFSLGAGDFDGDGQDDVLGSGRPTAYGLTKFRLHYFDRAGSPARTWTANEILATPTAAELTRDQRSDIVFAAGGGVGLLSGEIDRSVISEALPSYFLPRTEARILSALDTRIRNSAAILVVSSLDGRPGLFRQSRTQARIELAVDLPGGVEALAAEPVVADLFEDDTQFPCFDVVLAYRDARELTIYSACERAADSGEVVWREEPLATTLVLDPPAAIERGLIAADLDGDRHLDLLVGSEHGPYAAYGDGSAFEALRPYEVRRVGDDQALPMPIAAGDLSGDGIADLVLPLEVLLADASAGPRDLRHTGAWGKVGAPWSEALIADFNRDGSPDVVAASNQGLDIEFFGGTSSPSINPFTIATDRPVEHLAAGDLDGDRVTDLAFVQRAAGEEMPEELTIAFGALVGAPRERLTAARVMNVEQVMIFLSGSETTIANLGLIYDQEDEAGEPGSALALLGGGTNRTLPSLVELSTFSEDSSLNTAIGLSVAVGAFTAEGSGDVVALALEPSGELPNPDPVTSTAGVARDEFELWLLPDIGSRRGLATRLGWDFEPDLKPLVARDSVTELAAVMAAGDLDGDGVEELLLAAPDGTETRCLIASARLDPAAAQRVRAEPAIVVGESCTDPTQLSVEDLDDDGSTDVVLLAGAPDARRLFVLWGDGSARLDRGQLDDLTPDGAAPQAFAVFRSTPGAPHALAYVTRDEVRLLSPARGARRFEDSEGLMALELGTGIAAADVNGDGVTDLVVADAGAVRVLRAELEAR